MFSKTWWLNISVPLLKMFLSIIFTLSSKSVCPAWYIYSHSFTLIILKEEIIEGI